MMLRLFAALFLAALALPLAARAEPVNVSKGGPNSFSFSPMDVGMAKGFFAEHGLQPNVSNIDGAPRAHQAMAAGDIDIALASGPDMAFIAKGSPVTTVAAMAGKPDMMALIVLPDSPIKAPADLKGKRISVTSAGSLTNWLAHEISRQQGWGENGVDVESLGAQSAQLAALRTHQTDAMVMDITAAFKLESENQAHVLVKFGEIVPSFHMHVIHASNTFLAKDPDGVRRFLAAWFETVKWMRANKAETITIDAKVMNVSDAIAERTYDLVMPDLSTNGCFDPKAVEVLRRSYVEIGLLTSEPDMSKIYTEKYLPGPCPN